MYVITTNSLYNFRKYGFNRLSRLVFLHLWALIETEFEKRKINSYTSGKALFKKETRACKALYKYEYNYYAVTTNCNKNNTTSIVRQ